MIGEQPSAWAPLIRVAFHSIRPSQASSLIPLYIFVKSEPLASGTMQWSGARQPSCSQTS